MKKRKADDRVNQIMIEYNDEKIKLYESFALAIKTIIEKIIEEKKLKSKIQVITYRVKEKYKLKEKLKRPEGSSVYYIEKSIKKFSDIDDLAGVRIIFYLESEADKFSKLVEKELLNVKIKRKLKHDGYKAIHLVVNGLNEERLRLLEYSKFKGLKCEIQLTTPLFHAWSELEHDIIYKPTQEVKKRYPKEFEILDERFKDIMIRHINEASFEFENISYLYGELEKGRAIFNPEHIRSQNNNKIYQELLLLEKYTEEVNIGRYGNEEIVDLLRDCMNKVKTNKKKNESSILGEIPGKTLINIAEKCIDIINKIKNADFINAFNLLVEFCEYEEMGLSEKKILDAVKNFSKYQVLRQRKNSVAFLYKYQKDLIATILVWDNAKQIRNLKIINKALGKILEFSYELQEMRDWNTISLISGPLVPSEELRKIRREAIDLIKNLYGRVVDVKSKISLLETLENISRFHSNIDEKGRKFIYEELEYVMDFYEDIIFGKQDNIKAESPIVLEIEEKLIWIDKLGTENEEKIKKILSKIRSDEFYGLYRVLIGDIVYKEEKKYEAYEKRRNDTISSCLSKINLKSVEKWKIILNDMAQYGVEEESWKLQGFNSLLQRLAEKKPEIAEIILDDAVKNKKPLFKFVGQFLYGFRKEDNLQLWDKYVDIIIKNKSAEQLFDAYLSFLYINKKGIKKGVRRKDIELFQRSINKDRTFSFLRRKGVNEFAFHSSLMQGLSSIHAKNPKVIEKLFISEIEKNPLMPGFFIRELHHMEIRESIDCSKFRTETKKYILSKLVEIEDFNCDAQELLLNMEKKNFDSIMELILNRIKRAQKEKPKKRLGLHHYEAIPFNFNENLAEYISKNDEYINYIGKWSEKMTKEWSIYNWELGQFIEKIDKSFDKVLKNIIEKGDAKSLANAVDILRTVSVPSFEICFEIVKRTDDEKILNRVASLMHKTGVVSGEYGFSDSLRNKASSLEKYLDSAEDRVSRFAIKMIENLNEMADEQRKKEEEGIKLRKLEFEK